jgi:hypothetical protein
VDTFDLATLMRDPQSEGGLNVRYGTVTQVLDEQWIVVNASTADDPQLIQVRRGCSPAVGDRVAILVDKTTWLAVATMGGDTVLHDSSLTGSGRQGDPLGVGVPLQLGKDATTLKESLVNFWRSNRTENREDGRIGFFANTDKALYADNRIGSEVIARSYRPSDGKWSSAVEFGGYTALTRLANPTYYASLTNAGGGSYSNFYTDMWLPWLCNNYNTNASTNFGRYNDTVYGTGKPFGIYVYVGGLYFVSATFSCYGLSSEQHIRANISTSVGDYDFFAVDGAGGRGSGAWLIPLASGQVINFLARMSTGGAVQIGAETRLEVRLLFKNSAFG